MSLEASAYTEQNLSVKKEAVPTSFKLSVANSDATFVPSDVGIIGVKYLHHKGDMSTVIEVYPHTPAERAGVVVGDRVLEVDGLNIMSYDADQVFAMIAGRPGEPVRLKLMRCSATSACRAYDVNLVRMDMNQLASDKVFQIYKYGN
jgi:C-terminal processing protease CtpA/Prc